MRFPGFSTLKDSGMYNVNEGDDKILAISEYRIPKARRKSLVDNMNEIERAAISTINSCTQGLIHLNL